MRIVVGLGNPGLEYVGTRHNVGFEVLDTFAARLGWISSPKDFDRFAKSKFDGLTIDGTFSIHSGSASSGSTEKVLLLKPLTYMNLSGKSLLAASQFFQVSPEETMIVLDDIALPCGKLRIRGTGSSGGHNGLKDIERCLGTDKYPRLRIGIDPPPQFVPQKDYVLGKFSPAQRKQIDDAMTRACGAIATWIEKGLNAAMNQFNVVE